jgi:hypothetical protein
MADTTLTPEQLAELRDSPASTTSDNVTATARSADDVLKLDQAAAARGALAGGNDRGGPKSGWRMLRMARGIPG